MTQTVIPTRVLPIPKHTSADLQWLAPSPLWQGSVGPAASGIAQPWIAEFRTDDFVGEFTRLLVGGHADDLDQTSPAVAAGTSSATGPFRLYQPLSMRYYLVTATLACRRPGIPDHLASAQEGERVFFVLRQRTTDGTELALVDGQWQPVAGDVLAEGEEEHPLHSAPVTGFGAPGTTAARLGLPADRQASRRVYYGYIPVTRRESVAPRMSDPAKTLESLFGPLGPNNPLPTPLSMIEHPAVDALVDRVVVPWTLLRNTQLALSPRNIQYGSLFVLLDLMAWLKQEQLAVYQRIVLNTGLPSGSVAQKLFDGLNGIEIRVDGADQKLTTALSGLVTPTDYLPLTTGDDTPGSPPHTYDLRTNTSPALPATWLLGHQVAGSLTNLAADAMTGIPPRLPPELEGMIGLQGPGRTPNADGAPAAEARYVIRMVWTSPPCRPVLSEPTRAFELARAMDADAPARPILIQMPDINNLRQFNRGVAIEMPPSLRKVLTQVTPKILKEEGLDQGLEVQLGKICSLSLQIIMLVAFIVMFIFLILLNIVFWWLPFLKICFPVPMPASTTKGPKP